MDQGLPSAQHGMNERGMSGMIEERTTSPLETYDCWIVCAPNLVAGWRGSTVLHCRLSETNGEKRVDVVHSGSHWHVRLYPTVVFERSDTERV